MTRNVDHPHRSASSSDAPSRTRTVEEWQRVVLGPITRLTGETIPISYAVGRTLAHDVRARNPVPLFDNSSMDGYAVRSADVGGATRQHPVELTVIADVPAGSATDPVLGAGQAVRVMTGAPVPSTADAIVPVEDTVEYAEQARWVVPDDPEPLVHVFAEPIPERFIRRRAEDAPADALVLATGDVLTPRALASVAAAGHGEVEVARRPRVLVLSTGSELSPPGPDLPRGMIPDSNTALISALVEVTGCTASPGAPVGDDPAELMRRLDAIDPHEADLVLLSGGVSVGAFDVVKAALSPLGSVEFANVAMQPGKPQGFGRLGDGVPVFCLPGNPVSVVVSFELFVRPAMLTMLGRTGVHRHIIAGEAAVDWSTPEGRRQYMPVTVDTTTGGGPVRVRPSAAGGSGSHLVASLAAAQGLAIVDASVDRVREGDAVGVMTID